MSNTTKNGVKAMLNLIAILAIFVVSGVGNWMNPAIATMAAAWPEASVSAINNVATLPALVSLPVMIGIGFVAGKKIKYKNIMLLALIFSLIGGVGPYFIHPTWMVVLVFRAILGIGAGCFGVRTAILLNSLPKEKHATWIGIGTALYSGFNLILGPVVGALAKISWNTPFLVNFVCLITLILVLFFMEEPRIQEEIPEAGSVETKSEKIPGRVYFYAVLQAIATGSMYVLLLGVSTIVSERGIGDSVLAGTITTCYSIGCLASMGLGTVQNIFKKYTSFLGYILCVLGLVMFYIANNGVIMIAAVLIAGAGFMFGFSMLQVYVGMVAPASRMAFATTAVMVGNQLGVYISSYFITGFDGIFHLSNPYESAVFGGIFVFAVYAVLSIIRGIIVPKSEV